MDRADELTPNLVRHGSCPESVVITIVLPAYNEAPGIEVLLDRIRTAFVDSPIPYEVLVVDDGSTDETAAIITASAARAPIHLVRHERNRGYGRALGTGLREAMKRSEIVVTMDADDSHDPRLVPVMIAALNEGHDVVVASRFVRGGQEIGVPWQRRVLSHGASWLLRATQPCGGLRDYTSGFRAYRSTLLRDLVRRHGEGIAREGGFAAGLEIFLKARAAGARIGEVPLVLRYDRKLSASKMKILNAIGRTLAVLAHQLHEDHVHPPRRPAGGAEVPEPS